MKIAEILEIADKGTSWTMEIGGAYKPTSYQVTDIPKKMVTKLRIINEMMSEIKDSLEALKEWQEVTRLNGAATNTQTLLKSLEVWENE